MIINEGPATIATDPCIVSYDKLRFQSNMTGRNTYHADSTKSLHMFIDAEEEAQMKSVVEKLPAGCRVLYHSSTPKLPDLIRTSMIVRTLVRPQDRSRWNMGVRDNAITNLSSDTALHITGPSGFCSVRAASYFSKSFFTSARGCYSIGRWLRTRLTLSGFNAGDILCALNDSIDQAYHHLQRILASQDSRVGPGNSDYASRCLAAYKSHVAWSLVAESGTRGQDDMCSKIWVPTHHLVRSSRGMCVCACNRLDHAVYRMTELDIDDIQQSKWMWFAVWCHYGTISGSDITSRLTKGRQERSEGD